MEDVTTLDPETAFLVSNKRTGNEWELFKENVRPMKRGRNVNVLNEALKSQTDNHLKKSLIEERRRLIAAIDEYKGEDPLQPWLECIKWVQESFPTGGDCSGLVVIYEQCVRTFWHSDQYKDDLRYLKVWLEYAENCADAEVIYSFLHANGIGQEHSSYYISYALHMESKNKMKSANEIFNLGIERKAQPLEKLEAAFRKFFTRSMRRPKPPIEDETTDGCLPVRSFGTVLATGEARRQGKQKSDVAGKKQKLDRGAVVSIYKDTDASIPSHQPDLLKNDMKIYTLGTRAERNKENTAIPTKWTSTKIPQRPGSRTVAAAASACIEVFVDEECAESERTVKDGKSSLIQLRRVDGADLKKESELLKANPLRNFPQHSLPR
ncbi:Mad3/BUB1 homology region 1 [Macleaya cordata]|uniref:Mad3/BUB1 homology region 1 n=1 Tax=Macleaya cordata TaxID=56857 RepID=A0A200PS60_MACCD|nr:Mad3/BUB1 homology region 1 [Macleaya cordata]